MADSDIAVALDKGVLERLLEHISNGTTDLAESPMQVPVAHFTDPVRLSQEVELMKSLPLVVAHVSDLQGAGSFLTRDVLGIPLLIVRQKDGSIAVFRNMCRHRGGKVEDAPSGKRQLFMCRYHGWSYAAEGGDLKAVPFEETSGGIDRGCNSLIRFHSEVRHGLVFATLSDAPPAKVSDYLGEAIDGQIAPWKLEDSYVLIDETVELGVNWKLVMDGTIDNLHAQFLHPKPGGVGSRTINHSAVFREFGRHGKMFMARAKLRTQIERGEVTQASSKYIGTVMMIYPNNVMVEAPEHIELWNVLPVLGDPSRCTVRFRFLVRNEKRSPELETRVRKSWDILRLAGMEEDFPMEETIQQNAAAWPGGLYKYGMNEKPVQHLHRQLFQDIDQGSEGEATVRLG